MTTLLRDAYYAIVYVNDGGFIEGPILGIGKSERKAWRDSTERAQDFLAELLSARRKNPLPGDEKLSDERIIKKIVKEKFRWVWATKQLADDFEECDGEAVFGSLGGFVLCTRDEQARHAELKNRTPTAATAG